MPIPPPADNPVLLKVSSNVRTRLSDVDFSHHLSMRGLFKLSFRAFKSRSLRTILTTLGIGVGIGTVLFLVSLGFGLERILVEQIAKTEDSLYSMEAYFPSEDVIGISEKELKAVGEVPNVVEVSPIADLSGEMQAQNTSGNVKVRVVEPSYFRLSGTVPELGTPLVEGDPNGVVITSAVLKFFNLEPSQKTLGILFNLSVALSQEFTLPQQLKIVGIIQDDALDPTVIVPRGLLPGATLQYRSVLVRAATADSVLSVRDILLERGFSITAKLDLINQVKKVLTIATVILGAFGVTALTVSAIGMFNTMTIALLERTYEIGIMKSLGATNGDIQRLFLMEAFLMGFLGGVMGLVIGILGADIFNLALNILAKSLEGKAVDLFDRPWWFISGLVGFASLVSLITGYYPARRAVKLSPREAFKK